MIFNDEVRFKSVLIILIGNSIKFSKKGTIAVLIQKKESIENHLEIIIKDEGCGIE